MKKSFVTYWSCSTRLHQTQSSSAVNEKTPSVTAQGFFVNSAIQFSEWWKVRYNVTINNLFTRSSSTLTFSWRWKPGLWSDTGSTSITATSEEEMLHIFLSLQERRLCYVVKMERSTWERCVCAENYNELFPIRHRPHILIWQSHGWTQTDQCLAE